ncbi:restriction endonuclease subunit S [Ruminococcus sp. BSD2780120874_150323_B10]|uniref:restriction endonuclease subunit S n=1 Tax=Ruminococcus sp. BSD2780120874_150323_B10 TaxID=2787127 RepID=UPI00189C35D7|nr:restriction endonuclease subunit S [Ruminococcus sp. BSD2780120874_150323_B10]
MKLTDICEFHGGSQPPKSEWSSEYKDGYIRMLQIRDFTQEGRVTPEYVKISNRLRLCTEDDILIGRYGASVGKILSGKSGAYNVAIMKAVPDTSVVRKQYLRYYFLSPNFQNYILNLGGRAAQAGFSKDDLARLEITVVSLEEQDKIVNELSTLEKTISTKQKQLKEFDDLVKSRFIEMFGTLDLSIQGESWLPLSEISTIYTGTTPSTKEKENWDGKIPWITPAELSEDSFFVFDSERKITEKGLKSKSLSLMPKNTVLLSTRAPIGKVAIAGIEMCCNQGFKNFHCNNTILNPIYLYTLLKNNNEYLNSLGTGTTFKEISKTNVSKIKVPVANISLQNEFADFVKLIDKSKFVGYFTLNIFYVKSSHFHHPP